MSSYETPLIVFTVLSQLSIGLVAISTVWQLAGPEPPVGEVRTEWFVAGGVLLAAMIASLFHLGHPFLMYRALAHLGSAWLSREALSVGVLLGLIVVGLIFMRQKISRVLIAVTALVGLIAIICMGGTYSPPSFPAINNVLPFVFFLITAVVLGTSVGVLFAPESKRPLMTSILTISLIVALVIYLIVPFIWLSGGEVMQETGQSWIASPLYWGRIIVGLALPLGVIWKTKKVPVWLWAAILAGELMGRAVFFANTVHTATHIGFLY
jgi:DMSO reductase anchor subunit